MSQARETFRHRPVDPSTAVFREPVQTQPPTMSGHPAQPAGNALRRRATTPSR